MPAGSVIVSAPAASPAQASTTAFVLAATIASRSDAVAVHVQLVDRRGDRDRGRVGGRAAAPSARARTRTAGPPTRRTRARPATPPSRRPTKVVSRAANDPPLPLLPLPRLARRPGPGKTGTLVPSPARSDSSRPPGRGWYKRRTQIQPVGAPDLNPETLRTLDLGRPLGVPLRVHVPGVAILTATTRPPGCCSVASRGPSGRCRSGWRPRSRSRCCCCSRRSRTSTRTCWPRWGPGARSAR